MSNFIGEREKVNELYDGLKYRLNDGQVAVYDAEHDSFIVKNTEWWGTSVRTIDGKKLVHRIDTWFIGYPHE